MIILLAIVAALILIGLLVRSGRFSRPPAEQGRWWDQPAGDPVREPYEQGDR
jgi:hypothetical protein